MRPRSPSLAPTFGQAILHLPELLTAQMAVVVFTMLFVDLFDTTGTLIAVANQAGFLTEDGKLPRAKRALVSGSVATMGGAVLGVAARFQVPLPPRFAAVRDPKAVVGVHAPDRGTVAKAAGVLRGHDPERLDAFDVDGARRL